MTRLFLRNICVIVVLLLMAGCAESTQMQELLGMKIPLVMDVVCDTVGTRTLTSTSIQSSQFEEGEHINAYIKITGADDGVTSLGHPKVMEAGEEDDGVTPLSTVDGTTLYFPPGDNVMADIYAHYPTSAVNGTTSQEFSVQNPQTSDPAYKASDLMYASVSTPKTDKAVHLQFSHKMAKLVINATGEENVTIKKITLKSLQTTVSWVPSTGVISKATGGKSDIVIADESSFHASLSGAALFPPQTKNDTYFMEILCLDPSDSQQKTAYFYICTKEFDEGQVYTVNVKIGLKNIKDDDGIVTIEPWPSTIGTVNVEAVGNMGLKVERLDADNGSTTNQTLTSQMDNGETHYYYTYNGKSCTPVPIVTDGKETGATTLTVGTDYEVSYYNNVNAGTALVVITGKGDYDGLSTFTTFTINKAANTMTYPNSNAAFNSNLIRGGIVQNALIRPSYQTTEVYGHMTYGLYTDVSCNTPYTGDIASVDANGNVTMSKKGGPIYVKASMDDTGNFEAKEVSYQLTITAGDVASSIKIVWGDGKEDGKEEWPFTGTNITPSFSIQDNMGNTLAGASTNGVDYNYSFGNNILVGSNTAYVTITGRGEYEGTKTYYFSITKADNSWKTLNTPSKPIDCGDSKSNPQGTETGTLTIAAETFSIGGLPTFGTGTNYAGTTGNVTYSSANTSIATVSSVGVITAKAAGSTIITATVAGTDNYNKLSTEISVTVEKMTNIFVYNGTTEHFVSGGSPTGANSSGTYWCQVQGGSVQTCALTLTQNATVYALLVGAGGGCDGSTGSGGFGGYVRASKTYNKDSNPTFYIWCGGGGHSDCQGSTSDAIRQYGGWNGGGRPGTTGCSGAGGGATVVATTNSQTDWTWDTSTDKRILVAGGGGGASNGGNGGIDGGDEDDEVGTMKECTSNRSKWMGGQANVTGEAAGLATPTSDGGGGGAGYYGGMAGLENNSGTIKATGGHGGSNFIASSWTSLANGSAKASATFTDINFTMAENGHVKNNSGTVTTSLLRVFPGYVIIRYKYDR